PLPPPSSTNQESPSKGSVAPSSSKTAASAEYHAWTTDIRLRPSISLTHADLEMDKDIGPDEQAQSSNDEDIGSAHIPKGSRPALSISKMKVAYYPDAGLEQMVPDHFWIDEECKYNITAMYGHLNHLSSKDKKILTMAVNQWTRHLVIRQRVEDFQLGIESYQTRLNLTKPQWHATGFEYKHDYTVIDSPRAVMFRDKYRVLDQEGRGSEQGVHVCYSEAFEDKEDLSQPGELCWWPRQRGRLQTSKAYPMIKSFWHSRPLSDDL
nr:hypothetical protein [Tanacetum cinerariifolium]